MTGRHRVFTIPASVPFLPTLAEALLDGKLVPGFAPRHDPLALAAATVYLPTRRAAQALGEALLDALGREAALLPRILPLGEVDEDALAFADTAGLPERPSPLSTAARRLALAKLVRDYALMKEGLGEPSIATSQSAALQLADELARLFDDMTIAGLPFDVLDKPDFIPADLDKHWQDSLVFLKYVRPAWDKYLADSGFADPVAWRDLLLKREAERLAAGGGPVVAAGSTGTIPAVAELIATIARCPGGAVVLPGLDQTLDDESFRLIEGGKGGERQIEPSPGHPQFGLKRLIARIGIERGDVARLGAPDEREALLSEAFRPAATTERWRERGEDFDRRAALALQSFAVIEAADPREEALALALALRETLNTPRATAALVTPDRALARRVAAELRRWRIEVDDSGGVALGDSAAGRLARLALAVAADGFAPVPLIALLRHPLAKFGLPGRAADALEIAALRGPRPTAGAAGLARAIADARRLAAAKDLHRRDPRVKLSEQDWDSATDLSARAATALAPLLELPRSERVPFAALIAVHRAALERLGVDFARREPADFRALAQAFDRFADPAAQAAPLTLRDYADAFAQLLAAEPPVRPQFDAAARVRILGPLEARLLATDRVLLGGLNEGTWPPESRSDAWLNRPMRKRLGLDLPERRIGLAAHDFVQATGAREVIVSRARKESGVEMVPSRFLQRLAAVAPQAAWKAARERGGQYLDLAHALERAAPVEPAKRPAPKPPAEARPARLSVTEIETLIRDPYSIYARHVLRLHPLEEIDADAGAAERGTILHEAFAEFARAAPQELPTDALANLLAAGRKAFAAIDDYPELRAIWWPRFVRAAHWFIGHEIEHRKETSRVIAETTGKISFDAGGRPFILLARADRIDLRKDGSVAIADYKSGQPPSPSEILSGLAPQLPLEAAIARDGGFEDIPKGTSISEIAVIRISGGQPPGDWCVLDVTKARGAAAERAKKLGINTPDRLAAASRASLEALIRKFAAATAPYLSIPRPKWRGRFGEYDHLARIKEWSANEEGIE
ncbi:MAG: double-strand break repair protein AddB [Xanthobacteraceae bacterium]